MPIYADIRVWIGGGLLGLLFIAVLVPNATPPAIPSVETHAAHTEIPLLVAPVEPTLVTEVVTPTSQPAPAEEAVPLRVVASTEEMPPDVAQNIVAKTEAPAPETTDDPLEPHTSDVQASTSEVQAPASPEVTQEEPHTSDVQASTSDVQAPASPEVTQEEPHTSDVQASTSDVQAPASPEVTQASAWTLLELPDGSVKLILPTQAEPLPGEMIGQLKALLSKHAWEVKFDAAGNLYFIAPN